MHARFNYVDMDTSRFDEIDPFWRDSVSAYDGLVRGLFLRDGDSAHTLSFVVFESVLIGLERARSHVYHAASLLDAGEDAAVALRMAKAEASDAFAFAGDRAIQFHGGFGFTWECDAQLYLRRALFNQYCFGDGAHHRKRLAGLLL